MLLQMYTDNEIAIIVYELLTSFKLYNEIKF